MIAGALLTALSVVAAPPVAASPTTVQNAQFALPTMNRPAQPIPTASPLNGPANAYVQPATAIRPAPAPVQLQPGQLQITHCLVSLLEDVQVPALEAGALTTVEVVEGQYVAQGELLAKVDDSQPKLDKKAAEFERDAAMAKASDDIEVRFAQASLAVAGAELERALSIERRNAGAVTATEIQKLKLTKHRDELQIDRSKLELRVAKMNADVHQAAVDKSDAAVARRHIVSPIDGMVVTLLHEKGEWIASGEPVAQVVRIDRLRVEGFVNAADVSPSDLAEHAVLVEVSLAGGRVEQFQGQIVFISPIVQAGNKYRVRAEVENRADRGHPLLRPGMTATMTITP